MTLLAWIVVACVVVVIVTSITVTLTMDSGPDWLHAVAMPLCKLAIVVGVVAVVALVLAVLGLRVHVGLA